MGIITASARPDRDAPYNQPIRVYREPVKTTAGGCAATDLVLDEVLIERALRITGMTDRTALIHAALETLIARAARRRLAALGGSERDAGRSRRRRTRA